MAWLALAEVYYYHYFKYLGSMIDNKLYDNVDINRGVKCVFIRNDLLIRRFARCSRHVKLCFFQS